MLHWHAHRDKCALDENGTRTDGMIALQSSRDSDFTSALGQHAPSHESGTVATAKIRNRVLSWRCPCNVWCLATVLEGTSSGQNLRSAEHVTVTFAYQSLGVPSHSTVCSSPLLSSPCPLKFFPSLAGVSSLAVYN